jgi:hypothetical protein
MISEMWGFLCTAFRVPELRLQYSEVKPSQLQSPHQSFELNLLLRLQQSLQTPDLEVVALVASTTEISHVGNDRS